RRPHQRPHARDVSGQNRRRRLDGADHVRTGTRIHQEAARVSAHRRQCADGQSRQRCRGGGPLMKVGSVVTGRLLSMIPTLILATLIVFMLIRLIPGDPANAIAGEYATPERLAEIRSQLGLDKPLVLQYLGWLGGLFTGDLGTSFMTGQ